MYIICLYVLNLFCVYTIYDLNILYLQNETPLSTSEDFLAFTKQRSVIKSENHTWKPTKKKNMDTPGTKMKVHKVISPDDIILKYIDHNTVK